MPDQGAQQPRGFLEPPEGMTFYNVPPLAGRKRQRDEFDVDETFLAGRKRQRDEDDFGGDEYGTTNQTDSAVNNTQTQHINQEDNLGNVSGIAKSVATHQDTSAVEETAVKVNVTITKNEVRNGDTGLEVKDNGKWYPAIYHHELVRTVLSKDRLYGPAGSQQYTHPRKDGKLDGDEYDRTSYLPAQKYWGGDRAHRPTILFEFKKPDNAYPPTNPPNFTVSIDGVQRTIIDVINNKPLRDFAHLPTTISTKVEGWLMEAWFRYDPSLRFEDLIQRMPFKPKHNVYKSRAVINRLVRRRELFRDKGRCLSWMKSTWTKKWDLYLISEMNSNPNIANPNSTRHLEDLPAEGTKSMSRIISETKEFLAKGNHRALKGERREEKDREVERTLASNPAKKIKAALDQVSNGVVTVVQAPKKSRRSSSRRKQAVYNTTTAQPQQNVDPDPMVDRAGSMSNPNVESAGHIGMTRHLNVDEEDVHLAPGYPGHSVRAGELPAMEYPAVSEMMGNIAYPQPQFNAPNQPRQMQNAQGMQLPHQRYMNPADQQGTVGISGITERTQGRDGHNDYGVDIPGIPERTQGQDEQNGYGNDLAGFFDTMPNLLSATTDSFEESQRAPFQPPNPAYGGGLLVDEFQPQFHPAQPYGQNSRDGGGLMPSQPYRFEQPFGYVYDGGDLRSQSPYEGLQPDNDANEGDFMCGPSTYENDGQLPGSSMLEAQSSLMPQQQQSGSTYVDGNHHAWMEINPNGYALENNAYYVGISPDPGAPNASMQQMMTTNEIGQQITYPVQRNIVTPELGRTFDEDLVNSSRKSRKLK
ncbi:hypothetical protein EPUS_00305 [Endocarpon pusillum Z07020]|uniref:Uncharacterized protein n=1 Tax=Endocarpon pusillum (strain Z07020 / HMAS-L-300199) TaxID=1263415 RepID=U1GDH6_ENDPU|nr:uncharacterized protein EPUS_00305 [Endocarpon pusillum Z07020]ERF70118.1 hypothetical protein EPUS_00305 [Endocarpon pusillum Z07020]